MTMSDLLEHFIESRNPSKRYLESLRRTVRRAREYELEEVCQLSSHSINQFLSKMQDLQAETISNIRREICTLLRFAHEIEETDELPTRVRRVRVPRRAPRAWSLDQLERMVERAREDQTAISSRTSLRVCDVLPVWILVGYETGLRFSDLLSLRREDFYNKSIVLAEAKTGKSCVCPLTDVANEALENLLEHSPDGTVFKWFLPRRRAFCLWRAFLDRNGFEGSSRWLRRSAATYIERENAGGATVFLRHSAPHLARVHYIDLTLLAPPPSPPPLLAG